MQVKPWFSHEVGKDFLNRENGGGFYYTIFGEDVVQIGFLSSDVVSLRLLHNHV